MARSSSRIRSIFTKQSTTQSGLGTLPPLRLVPEPRGTRGGANCAKAAKSDGTSLCAGLRPGCSARDMRRILHQERNAVSKLGGKLGGQRSRRPSPGRRRCRSAPVEGRGEMNPLHRLALEIAPEEVAHGGPAPVFATVERAQAQRGVVRLNGLVLRFECHRNHGAVSPCRSFQWNWSGAAPIRSERGVDLPAVPAESTDVGARGFLSPVRHYVGRRGGEDEHSRVTRGPTCGRVRP